MNSQVLLLAVCIGVGAVIIGLAIMIIARSYRAVRQGEALIVYSLGGGEPRVTFTGALVLPIVGRAEVMDISIKTIVIVRRGREGLGCADHLRADVEARFFLRVNKTVDDILRVAQSVGCARAAEPRVLEELFSAKFSEALKIVASQFKLEELLGQRAHAKDKVIEVIGRDLNGYVLDDVVIDALVQTPVELLDPSNILDAQGIRKIRSLTDGVERLGGGRGAGAGDQLAARLRELGLLDVRIGLEVSCDVSPERAPLTLAIGGATEAVMARLPPEVTAATVAAAGRGELTIAAGRATFRWTEPRLDEGEIIAAAQLVHALRGDPGAYR